MTPCGSELTPTLKHGLVSSNDPAWLSDKHNGCYATAGGVVQRQQIFIAAARLNFKVSMLPCQTIHNLLVETWKTASKSNLQGEDMKVVAEFEHKKNKNKG